MSVDALDDLIARRGGAGAVVNRRVRTGGGRPLVRRLDYVLADTIDDEDETFDDELVEGVIGRNAMAVLYGDSNSGKTFAAVDIGCSVALGKRWLGRNTAPGAVLYLATEAAQSVRMRLKAYQRHHGVRVPSFVIVQSPINLFDGEADVTAVLTLVETLEQQLGTRFALIIGDTLARISAGANENSGEDMGVVLKHADAIRAATGATFLWIHHTGKDQARGMRGWSGMRAAIDTEIEITADEAAGVRTLEITKQRDLPGKGDRMGFHLLPVELGVNRWGSARGSCVAVPADAPVKATGKRQSEIAGAIEEFLEQRGTGCLRGALAKHFDGRYVRQSVYKEVKKMLDTGRLIEVAGVVALPGRPA
jgi:RecA-family ATPase